jgi:hypothetical protein
MLHTIAAPARRVSPRPRVLVSAKLIADRSPIRLWDDLSGCEEREHAPLTVPLEILRNYAQKL